MVRGHAINRGRARLWSGGLAVCLAGMLAAALPLGAAKAEGDNPIIDAHTHPIRNTLRSSPDESMRDALRLMDRLGVTMAILSPPPFPSAERGIYGLKELQSLVGEHPGRLAFTAGGETLNPMIQQVPPDKVTPDWIRRFEQEAERIAQSGAAGFGELAAEHFSSRRGRHPYESARPDHPLFLAIANIAAKYGMPVEFHMEAVPRDMPIPPDRSGAPNPASLKENISAFERLLDSNPKARIVWVNAGWDLSGERTVPLMRSLLQRHPNLYMTIKIDHSGSKQNSPFGPDGEVKPGWIAMLRAFSDRFMIGSDQFFDQEPERIEKARKFVDALPPDLSRRVASENVKHIYRLANP